MEFFYDEGYFTISGEHSLEMMRFTDKHGFTLKEHNFYSDTKKYNYKSDLEKILKNQKVDIINFKIRTSEKNSSITRNFTGRLYRGYKDSSKSFCPDRR